MAKFTLEINCDNAAFHPELKTKGFYEPGADGVELSKVLQKLSEKIKRNIVRSSSKYPLTDSNGNIVGHAEYQEGE